MATLLAFVLAGAGPVGPAHAEAPTPLLERGKPVDWWFVFKLNSKAFPRCGGKPEEPIRQTCPFGGKVQNYSVFGQQFVFASSADGKLKQGAGCVGQGATDPVGATFDQIYNGRLNYVVWNDQFYSSPAIKGCGDSCGAPWGHSKGVLAWDRDGNGVVMQVTTPSWPAAASKRNPRPVADGNTLGCVKNNNVKFSQHFFALKLDKDDLVKVLQGLENASVVTDPSNPQLVRLGGPSDIQELADKLGKKSKSTTFTKVELSSGVTLISKPSKLQVPPWQLVSAAIAGVPLRAATWWAKPQIFSTTAARKVTCWEDGLDDAGPVQIATSGHWKNKEFGLKGGPSPDFNHAKFGVAQKGRRLTIFGDLNQQGSAFKPSCGSSQNGRGGLFYVVDDPTLHDSVTDLIDGDSAPTRPPKK